jgi:hypothetical protein
MKIPMESRQRVVYLNRCRSHARESGVDSEMNDWYKKKLAGRPLFFNTCAFYSFL